MKTTKKESNFALLKLIKTPKTVTTNLAKAIKKATAKSKKDLIENNLQLETWKKKKHQTIRMDRIIRMPAFFRFDQKDDYGDLERVAALDCPDVAAVQGANYFVLIDGERRVNYLRREGHSSIECRVVGEARSFSQLAATRANVTTKFSKPLSTCELALGLTMLHEHLIREFGQDAFFGRGGDRKGRGKDKLNRNEYIAGMVGIKPWAVRALIDFGLELGHYALIGLHNREETRNLSLREIHSLNASLKRRRLGNKIRNLLEALEESDSTDDEMATAAGKTAFQVITQERERRELENRGSEADENAEEEAEDDDEENDEDHDDEDEEDEDEDDEGDEEDEEDDEDENDGNEPTSDSFPDLEELITAHIRSCESFKNKYSARDKPSTLRKRFKKVEKSWEAWKYHIYDQEA